MEVYTYVIHDLTSGWVYSILDTLGTTAIHFIKVSVTYHENTILGSSTEKNFLISEADITIIPLLINYSGNYIAFILLLL